MIETISRTGYAFLRYLATRLLRIDLMLLALVVTLTTSRTPVYREAAREGRLVVGVGAFTADAAEIDAETVRASRLVVDDPAGARHEAGDLIQAGMNVGAIPALAGLIWALLIFRRWPVSLEEHQPHHS